MPPVRERCYGWPRCRGPEEPAGVLRISIAHDERRWPGMLLPGTYNGVMCRHLLDAPAEAPDTLVAWLLRHRQPGGGVPHPRHGGCRCFQETGS